MYLLTTNNMFAAVIRVQNGEVAEPVATANDYVRHAPCCRRLRAVLRRGRSLTLGFTELMIGAPMSITSPVLEMAIIEGGYHGSEGKAAGFVPAPKIEKEKLSRW